jgi:hypothetical protein
MTTRILRLSSGLAGLFLLMLLDSADLQAQTGGKAVVILQNGARIRGNLSFPSCGDEMPALTLKHGERIPLSWDRIYALRVRPGVLRSIDSAAKPKRPVTDIPERGFYHDILWSFFFNNDDFSTGLHVVNGYRINRWVSAGAGLGIDYYGSISTLPVYAQVKGHLPGKSTQPFLHGGIGYAPAWADKTYGDYEVYESRGGLFWQVGLGYTIPLRGPALHLSAGYRSQTAGLDYRYNWGTWLPDNSYAPVEVSEKRQLRRAYFSIGLSLF